jgi:N-acetylglucosamine-6-phosphate deacetylase
MIASNEIVTGRLVLEDRVEPGHVFVEDGRIAGFDHDERAAEGPWIMPGFIDLHVHGCGGYDAMGPESSLDGMARTLLGHGVTSFLPTAVTAPIESLKGFGDRVRDWMQHAPADGADPLGFNLEGPFISPQLVGAQNPAFVRAPADVSFDDLLPLVGAFRLTTIAPEQPGALELIGWLREHGVITSLGHSVANASEAASGYDAGARSTTHLFNAMTGVHHHKPGLATVALSRDDVFIELIADGQHVDRAVWPLILRAKPATRLVLVSDGIELAATTRKRGTLGGLDIEVHGDRCTLVSNGGLAGSVITLDTAVRNLALFGVGLPNASAAASANPAALLGLGDRGWIATGLRADLVELDSGFRVQKVMRGGTWINDQLLGSTTR